MLEESAAILEGMGEKLVLNSALVSLGSVDLELGEYTAARARLEHALAIAREMEQPWGIVDTLQGSWPCLPDCRGLLYRSVLL